MLKYIYNCLKKLYYSLCYQEVRFLANITTIVTFLVKALLKSNKSTSKLKLFAKNLVLYNTIVPRLKAIFNNLVDLHVSQLLGTSCTCWSGAFRGIVI